MCRQCDIKSIKAETAKDNLPDYDAMLEKGMRLRDKTAFEIRKAVEAEEEAGGEEFLPDELILAAVLGIAFLRAGEPAVEQMFRTMDAEGIRALDKAINEAEPSFRQVFSYSDTEKKTKEAIRHVMRSGSGLAGAKSTIDDLFRTNEILDDMVQATKYFTNNYFNLQVAPQLRNIVQNALNTGTLDESTYQLVRQAMSDRLHSVPYWRIVANAAASRGYHYGAVKAGMVLGKRGYRIVAVIDSRTSDTCFVGSTKVRSIGGLEAVSRAEYTGEILTVTTARGYKFEATPNHPILTAQGFLPLHKIKPRKQIIYSVPPNVTGIASDNDIGVETSIAELFDTISQPPGSDILSRSASATDFYGDGVGCKNKINIAPTQRYLSTIRDSLTGKYVCDDSLGFASYLAGFFAPFSSCDDLLFARRVAGMPTQNQPMFPCNGVKPFIASMRKRFLYFTRLASIVIHSDNPSAVCGNSYVSDTTWKGRHNATFFEYRGNSSNGNGVFPSYLSCASSKSVEPDYIVDVFSDFRTCHVYTLQTSTGMYTAEGVIVKNCRAMNGKEFWLADAEVYATRAATAQNDEIKTVAPFVKNVEQVLGKTSAELRDAGFLLPPFHCFCRSSIQFI